MYHEGRFLGFFKGQIPFSVHRYNKSPKGYVRAMATRPFQDIWMKGFEGKGMYAWWNRE